MFAVTTCMLFLALSSVIIAHVTDERSSSILIDGNGESKERSNSLHYGESMERGERSNSMHYGESKEKERSNPWHYGNE